VTGRCICVSARGLTKRYGRILAVDGLSFDVRPSVPCCPSALSLGSSPAATRVDLDADGQIKGCPDRVSARTDSPAGPG
jgi:hypothetical protein